MPSSKHKILLTNCDDTKDSLYLEFDKGNSFGMTLIETLVMMKPLHGKGEDAVYNIYRDVGKKRCIDYTQLSNTLTDLQIESQPPAPGYASDCRVVYFALEFEMKFG